MKIMSMHFKQKDDIWRRLKNVFEYSVKKNIDLNNVDLDIIEVDRPKPFKLKKRAGHKWGQWAANNFEKITQWNNYIQNTDENVLLLDGDIILLDSPLDVFERDFDIAYTYSKKNKAPLNTGVIFVKSNKKAKKFFQLWYNNTLKMVKNENFYKEWLNKMKGLTQPAFYCSLQEMKRKLKIIELPGNVYNATDPYWNNLKDTKILHIKGRLQKMVTDKKELNIEWKEAYDVWKRIEKEFIGENNNG